MSRVLNAVEIDLFEDTAHPQITQMIEEGNR